VVPPERAAGKQFNSMVLGDRDLLLDTDRSGGHGFRRHDALALRRGIRSVSGTPRHPGRPGPCRARACGYGRPRLPEANLLIPRGEVDPVSGIPAYRGAAVEVIPVGKRRNASAGVGTGSRP